MSLSNFDAFKSELNALNDIVRGWENKTIRDSELRERFRILFRTWVSVLHPDLRPIVQNKREFFKLNGELASIAQLSSKFGKVLQYKKHFTRALEYANNLVFFLPAEGKLAHPSTFDDLFISSVPDLPKSIIPNSIFGWKSKMEAFVDSNVFDRSVFLMIKYRQKNNELLDEIKKVLLKDNLNGILASDHDITDDLYNPIACLLCCSKGIAIFDEPEEDQEHNPNVAYELGMLHLLGRKTLILKHNSLKTLHTDILMKIYRGYETIEDVNQELKDWIKKLES
jgi:hypothetical protein